MSLEKPVAAWSGLVGVLAVCIGAIAATMLVTAAFASNHAQSSHRRAHSSDFAVLKSSRGRAHRAAAMAEAPAGAVLADSTAAGTSVYAAHRAGGTELCLFAIRQSGSVGGACGPTAKVEETGIDLVSLPANGSTLSVTLLLPDGVSSVRAADDSGVSQAVGVSNNVAVIEDSQLTTVSYTLPSGASHKIDVAGMLKRESAQVSADS